VRALSERQIKTCERSRKPRCRCRCRGQLHGIRAEGYVQQPMFHIPLEEQHQSKEQTGDPR